MLSLKKTTKEIGAAGESAAASFLERRGYRIVARNYWKPYGEIDIVAEKGNMLHFVEVKAVSRESSIDISRETNDYRPEELVHPEKIRRLHRAIQAYLLEKGEEREFRLDVIGVFLDFRKRTARCRIFENVY